MTLSVVIPAHNAADTLGATLDSLLAQTRGDWQAIIVDDGSTDATRRIAETYVARDQRFSLLTNDGAPEGVSAARNRGIAAASGRWLLFLDADDTIAAAFVERMVGKLEATPGARVAYCGSIRLTAAGRRRPPWFSTDVARAPFETLARSFPLVVHGAVLDRGLVVEQGGFDARLRTAEDMDFFQRIARTGVAFLAVPEPLALYHMRQGSLSTDVRAMLADGTAVIDRAFGVDPRVVRPSPRHAAGADPMAGSKEMAQGVNALWCAAVDVGQGGNGVALLMALPDRRGDLAELCRQTIVEGLVFGAQRLPDELPHDDPAFVERVRALLADVERAACRPGLARRLQFALEPEIFSPQHLTDRLVVDGTLLVRQDIAHLAPIAVDAGIDRVQVEFRSGCQDRRPYRSACRGRLLGRRRDAAGARFGEPWRIAEVRQARATAGLLDARNGERRSPGRRGGDGQAASPRGPGAEPARACQSCPQRGGAGGDRRRRVGRARHRRADRRGADDGRANRRDGPGEARRADGGHR